MGSDMRTQMILMKCDSIGLTEFRHVNGDFCILDILLTKKLTLIIKLNGYCMLLLS